MPGYAERCVPCTPPPALTGSFPDSRAWLALLWGLSGAGSRRPWLPWPRGAAEGCPLRPCPAAGGGSALGHVRSPRCPRPALRLAGSPLPLGASKKTPKAKENWGGLPLSHVLEIVLNSSLTHSVPLRLYNQL